MTWDCLNHHARYSTGSITSALLSNSTAMCLQPKEFHCKMDNRAHRVLDASSGTCQMHFRLQLAIVTPVVPHVWHPQCTCRARCCVPHDSRTMSRVTQQAPHVQFDIITTRISDHISSGLPSAPATHCCSWWMCTANNQLTLNACI